MIFHPSKTATDPRLEPHGPPAAAITVHVIQTLTVGGIETLVIDLLRKDPNHRVITLEGRVCDMVADWPDLAKLGDRIDSLEKGAGWAPRAVVKLACHLKALAPQRGTHHPGQPKSSGNHGLRRKRAGRFVK